MSINVGIIGGGSIATHHIRGYRQAEARVVMIADADEAIARSLAAELQCRWTAEYGELLENPDIQAVSVCVPNWLHYEVAAAAIQAGKAVLCEKPMSISLEQAEALRQMVYEHNTFFQVGYMKRYHPAMQRFCEWLPQLGSIEMGLLRCYQPFPNWLWTDPTSWFTQKRLSGGGPLVHGGSHMLDLLHWCLGDVVAVSARVHMKADTDVDWHTGAMLEMANGSTILFECGWFEHSNHGPKQDGWDELYQLRGPEGVATLYPSFWDRPTTLVPTAELYTEATHSTQRFAEGPFDYFAAEIADFVERVEQNRDPSITVDAGYKVDRLIQAMYLSSERQQRIVLDPIDRYPMP
ncbi:MAG: Gfo/Idh/MocA family oxidoreductase [Chloroflexi bacterium]|nr:Gfo/Idh/MocA family oxidoreductase [Chloroflexota bacterium]